MKGAVDGRAKRIWEREDSQARAERVVFENLKFRYTSKQCNIHTCSKVVKDLTGQTSLPCLPCLLMTVPGGGLGGDRDNACMLC